MHTYFNFSGYGFISFIFIKVYSCGPTPYIQDAYDSIQWSKIHNTPLHFVYHDPCMVDHFLYCILYVCINTIVYRSIADHACILTTSCQT